MIKYSGSKGYTLVEFIAILGVGSVLVVGLTFFLRAQTENAVRTRDYVIALNLARLQMEKASATSIGGAEWGSRLFNDPLFPGMLGQQTVTALRTNASPSATLFQIDEEVGYGPAGGPYNPANRLVILSTYRESRVVFGDGQ